jgi:hypothetical protein
VRIKRAEEDVEEEDVDYDDEAPMVKMRRADRARYQDHAGPLALGAARKAGAGGGAGRAIELRPGGGEVPPAPPPKMEAMNHGLDPEQMMVTKMRFKEKRESFHQSIFEGHWEAAWKFVAVPDPYARTRIELEAALGEVRLGKDLKRSRNIHQLAPEAVEEHERGEWEQSQWAPRPKSWGKNFKGNGKDKDKEGA